MKNQKHFTPAQNSPYLLSPDEMKNPQKLIRDFFSYRTLGEHRSVLWSILSTAITRNDLELYAANEVGEWVIYFRELEEMIEASWLLNCKKDDY